MALLVEAQDPKEWDALVADHQTTPAAVVREALAIVNALDAYRAAIDSGVDATAAENAFRRQFAVFDDLVNAVCGVALSHDAPPAASEISIVAPGSSTTADAQRQSELLRRFAQLPKPR